MLAQITEEDIRVIAEIGVNHDGSLDKAIKLIEEAAKCGCHGVKFQIFKAERLSGKQTPKVDYQERSGGSSETHYEMLKRLEFSALNHARAKEVATRLGLDFITTPYDPVSAEEAYRVGVRKFKVASADLGDIYLHEMIARLEPHEVLLGTGMSNIPSIQRTLDMYNKIKPSLLHCVSAYPCDDAEINALACETLRNVFSGHEVGYSDHGKGIVPAIVFASRGTRLFERHFTLNIKDDGPDHYASSDPTEMKQYVDALKRTCVITGSSEKVQQKGEYGMSNISKKGIKAKCFIGKGEVINFENTYALRPAIEGISVDVAYMVMGKHAQRNILADSFIQWDDIAQ